MNTSLTRRLERLETRLLAVASEPTVITLDFVDANGTVVDHKDFTVNGENKPHAAFGTSRNPLAAGCWRADGNHFGLCRYQRYRARLETSTCQRTLSADGALFEMVRLDGSRSGLTNEEMEKFVESFPVERV